MAEALRKPAPRDEAPEAPRPPFAPVAPADQRAKQRTAASDKLRKLRRRERIRWVLFALLPLALIVGGYWYFTGGQVMSTDDAYVNAEKVGVSTDVSGIVQEVAVKDNEHVAAGQVLYRLDPRQFQIALDNAKANLAQIALMIESMKQDYKRMVSDAAAQQAQVDLDQTNYDRAAMLLKTGAGTVEQRDQTYAALRQSNAAHERDVALQNAADRQVELAKAAIHNATETLKMSQIVLGYTVLRAPFSGVIEVRQAELGEIMVPGTPVVTLADLDHVWLRAYINETDIGKVRYGQTATVTTDTYPGKKYTGRVSFISSNAEFTPKSVETHAERVTLVYRIRIDIDNPSHELVPGMPADATLRALPPGEASSAPKSGAQAAPQSAPKSMQ